MPPTRMHSPLPPDSPFLLDHEHAYASWRRRKLAADPRHSPIALADIGNLRDDEVDALLRQCQATNYALFCTPGLPDDPETALQRFGQKMGLLGLDQNLCAEDSGVTAITVKPTATDHTYIPYTNRPLGWHTDGYYNASDQQIHAWLLYCAQPAAEGGTNELLDHEIAYIRIRDENPEWIRALMAPDAFTIPGNVEGGQLIRPDHTGPVFTVSPTSGTLHMRYSARQRNIEWKDDKATRDAAAFLLDLLGGGEDAIIRRRLNAGEGVISNNVLHRREGFRDGDDPRTKRMVYRARYYQRLSPPTET